MIVRHQFKSRTQNVNGGVKEYIPALSGLVTNCKPGSLTEELIFGQLISKCCRTRIRGRLPQEPEPGLENEITVHKQFENKAFFRLKVHMRCIMRQLYGKINRKKDIPSCVTDVDHLSILPIVPHARQRKKLARNVTVKDISWLFADTPRQ